MRVFKIKSFGKWAAREGLSDAALVDAVNEMDKGLVEADLGGHLFKKRVALAGRGKSSGARTILAYKRCDKAFFVYGFAKNARANIDAKELQALKLFAELLLNYNEDELDRALSSNALIEVVHDE